MNIKQIALIISSIVCMTSNATFLQDTLLTELPLFACSCNMIDISPLVYAGGPYPDACNTLKMYTIQDIAHSIVHDSSEEQEKRITEIASALKTLDALLTEKQRALNERNIIETQIQIKKAIAIKQHELICKIAKNSNQFINTMNSKTRKNK